MRPDATYLPYRRNYRGRRSYEALIRRACPQPSKTKFTILSQLEEVSSPPPTGDLCEAKSLPVVSSHNLTILQCNLNGWLSHNAKLSGRLDLLSYKPAII